MFLEPASGEPTFTESLIERRAPFRWGVDSETGRLTDVLLSRPDHLEMVPCNAVTRSSLAKGLAFCGDTAAEQHRGLAERLELAGVKCHFVPPSPVMPDLAFTRDSVLMTPWGLVELRPSEPHRRGEPARAARALASLGVPMLGRIEEGRVEGGDVCILRPGLLLIGYSGDRTDRAGAKALGALFERKGWEVAYSCFDPRFLHLDTQFTMVSRDLAVACLDTLEEGLADRLDGLGIELIAATREEVDRLGANLLSLGRGRIVTPADNRRINRALGSAGFKVIEVDIDQFARCGGGVHCLTMPLARTPG
jgi:N-dimethylarginine dimethylaminohydrolase